MRTRSRRGNRDEPRTIGGRYRLARRIGRGGMATVYEARDTQLGRSVAIKVMRSELRDNARFLRRFAAEARRAASVSHPHVAAVYDVGTDPEPYIVMELVEGGDLAALVRRVGRVAPERAARLVADAADALAAAHASGLVHRDIKPGNILIGADGRAKVADFGIARATGDESLTRTGAALGSVEYFSPEQARGERAGAASDIYSLGVVMYELLTGRRPFTGDTPYAVATARLSRPAPDPHVHAREVPGELAGILRRAMAQRPKDRFATAAGMRDALEAFLAAGTEKPAAAAQPDASAQPASSAQPAGSAARGRARRPRSRARALPAVLLLGIRAVGGFLWTDWLFGAVGGEVGGLAGITVRSPGGEVGENPTASPTLAPPTATPEVTPRPTPDRTPVPTPPPPSRVPASTPAAPQPTAVVVAVAQPDDAVAAFYGHVESGRFDEAYALWSDRMKATYPREPNLDGRFAETADIAFSALYVASQSANAATVQANFRETYESGSSRDFIGYWRLVNVDGRWLLDEPTY